jgi:hypothetical protein
MGVGGRGFHSSTVHLNLGRFFISETIQRSLQKALTLS